MLWSVESIANTVKEYVNWIRAVGPANENQLFFADYDRYPIEHRSTIDRT